MRDLKQYLRAVQEADLVGEATLQDVTTEHCIVYAVRIVVLMTEERLLGLQVTG